MPHEPPIDTWPGSLDIGPLFVFVALALGAPILGYVFLVLDIRRYLRSLRRALVRVVHRSGHTPDWATPYTPRCVAALGLTWPCTEQQVTEAYRRKVKPLHPDRGGDRDKFLMLQRHFEEALRLVRADDGALSAAPGARQYDNATPRAAGESP